MFEVQDEFDLQPGYFEVVDHLGDFVVADFFDDLRINNDSVEGDEIGDLFTCVDGLVDDGKPGLLLVGDLLLLELDHHGIFIGLFQ